MLKRQEKLLGRLAALLREEKEVLIREDGKRLVGIVSAKRSLQDQLESMEEARKIEWGDLSLGQMAGRLDRKSGERLIERGRSISAAIKEIKDLQETNMMLTRQSASYSQKMLEILQTAVRKSGITYGQNGAVESAGGVMASIDRSV